MATTDETLAVAAATRARLRDVTEAQRVAIAREWVDAWDTLAPALRDGYADILARAAAGQRVPRYLVARDARLKAALAQVRATLREVSQTTVERIHADTESVVTAAPPDVERVIRTQLPASATGFPVAHPAPDALDAIITRVGQRIHAQSAPLSSWTEQAMKRELVRGIAAGAGPRETARNIMQATERRFEGGLGRALNIARTETLDAYRAAHAATTAENLDIIVGQRWLATLDARTCSSCFGRHGTVFPPDEIGPADHPSGRCSFVPVTKPWRDLGIDLDEPAPVWQDRDQWWDSLTPGTQDRMLGPTRAAALRDGHITPEQLSVRVENPDWRPHYREATLTELGLKGA